MIRPPRPPTWQSGGPDRNQPGRRELLKQNAGKEFDQVRARPRPGPYRRAWASKSLQLDQCLPLFRRESGGLDKLTMKYLGYHYEPRAPEDDSPVAASAAVPRRSSGAKPLAEDRIMRPRTRFVRHPNGLAYINVFLSPLMNSVAKSGGKRCCARRDPGRSVMTISLPRSRRCGPASRPDRRRSATSRSSPHPAG